MAHNQKLININVLSVVKQNTYATMSRFLVLPNIVINSAHITRVITKKHGYDIHFVNHEFAGFWFLGSGRVDTDPEILRVYNNTDPKYCEKTYNAVTEWIKNCNK